MLKSQRRVKTAALIVLFTVLSFGTVASAGGRPLTANLSSANEVQTPPVSSGASGTARIELNQGQETICWEITGTGLTGTPQAAHIHTGAAGQNGGVVVLFFGSATPLPASGCTSVSADLIKEIRQSPELFYVNVHTQAFPNGEMRGQLTGH